MAAASRAGLFDAIYKELAETRSPVFTKAAVGARAVTAGLSTALELRTGALVSARRLEAHLTLLEGPPGYARVAQDDAKQRQVGHQMSHLQPSS